MNMAFSSGSSRSAMSASSLAQIGRAREPSSSASFLTCWKYGTDSGSFTASSETFAA